MSTGLSLYDAPVSSGNDSGWLLNHMGGKFTLMRRGYYEADQIDALLSLHQTMAERGIGLAIIQIDADQEQQSSIPNCRTTRVYSPSVMTCNKTVSI